MLRPRTISKGALLFFLLLAACGCIGCSAPQGELPTAPVSGKVTYQGKPLTRGTITFIPTAAKGKGVRNASGMLDANGHYSLTTRRDGDGALLGPHKVAIVSREEASPEMGKKFDEKGLERPGRELKSFIPARYGNPEKSRLTAEVKRQRNQIDFDLKE